MSESALSAIEILATPRRCFEVVADVDSYPEWASGVRTVSVHGRDAHGRPERVTLTVDAVIRQVEVTVRYTYDPPYTIRWTGEPGPDILELDGSYEFRATEQGTEVIYMLRISPSFQVPGFLRTSAEKQLIGTALRELRHRVENL